MGVAALVIMDDTVEGLVVAVVDPEAVAQERPGHAVDLPEGPEEVVAAGEERLEDVDALADRRGRGAQLGLVGRADRLRGRLARGALRGVGSEGR